MTVSLHCIQEFSIRIKKSGECEDDEDDEDDEDEPEYVTNNPSDYGSDANLGDPSGYINIGVIPTTASVTESDPILDTGRIITFPNWVQVGVSASSMVIIVC
jgi:hypothetical protein